MLPSEILSKAADIVEAPGAWIQGEYATTHSGTKVASDSPVACRFCAWGAIESAASRRYDLTVPAGDAEETALETLWNLVGGDIEAWNDVEGRTQSEVVAALRKAASIAKEQEHSDAL